MQRYAAIIGCWVFLCLAFSSVAWAAADPIQVTVSCPETADKRATVNADITLTSHRDVAISLPRGALVINNGTVTGTAPHFVGPLSFSVGVTVPPRGVVHLPLIPVKIPADAKSGTFVSLGFGFLAAGNQGMGAGACAIAIN
jgi:hypothetical protein